MPCSSPYHGDSLMPKEAERRVWQIGAGEANRSYADTFLNHGVALIGPGDPGPWSADRYPIEKGARFVRTFATGVRKGDIMLLREGRSTIRAVGIVAGGYQHLPVFDDVNGWDLQHCRRVHWFDLTERHDFRTPVFGANPSRLSRVYKDEVKQYAIRFVASPPTECQDRMLPDLPEEEADLAPEDIPADLREVIREMLDLARHYRKSAATSGWPEERETVAHLVIPFLRALGWSPERIAVEWRKIDLCLFGSLPRAPENCRFVIEAKRLAYGLQGGFGQAREYLAELGVERDVIATDGLRYRMYDAANDFTPVAYANLRRLKRSALMLFSRMRSP